MDLTNWLEKVWDALDEEDEVKRDRLLQAADMLLQENEMPGSALPGGDSERTAA